MALNKKGASAIHALPAVGAAIILAGLLAAVAACQNTGRTLDIDDEDSTATVNSGDIWNPATPGKPTNPPSRIAIYWDGDETADRAGGTITWPAFNLGVPLEESKTAKAVFTNPPLGFDNLQWTFETETNTKANESADGLVKFDGSVWRTGAQGKSPSEMSIIAGKGVTKAKVTVWNCDSTGKRGTVSAFFFLDIVAFGTPIPPTLQIHWDGDTTQSHNNDTLTWLPGSSPLDLTAFITNPPAGAKVRWTISGSADVVVFGPSYTAGSLVSPDTAVTIRPGSQFKTETVTVTAALEGHPEAAGSFTINSGYIPVTSVTLSSNTATMKAGGKLLLTVTVVPDNATDPTVTWESDDDDVAMVVSVDPVTGEVTVTTGEVGDVANITATAGGESATCTVTVGK